LKAFVRLARALPRAAKEVLDAARSEGLEHPVLPALHAALIERASTCDALLGS